MAEQEFKSNQNTVPSQVGNQPTNNGRTSVPQRAFDRNRPPSRFPPRNGSTPRPGGAPGTPSTDQAGNRNRFDRRRPNNGGRQNNRQKEDPNALETQVILVRRITRVVKGGKRMRFSALVVSGDRAGKIGFGLKKGLDFQDAVAKATKKAQDSAIKIKLNDNGSVDFPIQEKYKSCELMLKPAKSGTGVIAGGFLRPVLELAGVKNIYTKIIGSRNKIAGVQTALKTLRKFESK